MRLQPSWCFGSGVAIDESHADRWKTSIGTGRLQGVELSGSSDVRMVAFSRTRVTVAHDRKMMMSGMEAVRLEQMIEHRLDFCRRNQRRLAAHLTHEMLVIVLHGEMPAAWLVSEVHVMDQSNPGQIIERPICRRRIDRNPLFFDTSEDLLSGEESFVVARQDGADRPAWHGETQASVANSLVNCFLEIGSSLTHHFATIAIRNIVATNLCCNYLQQ